MEKSVITIRDLRVLRNRGRVTAKVSFGRFGLPVNMLTDVELDLGREDVKDLVEKLEKLCVTEFLTAMAEMRGDQAEPESEPAKAAPRKRAPRTTRHI